MKSFAVKRDEKDPRWLGKYIPWCNKQSGKNWSGGNEVYPYYGFDKCGIWNNRSSESNFTRIITLDEWEAEFMQPKLAGREYDERLIRQWHLNACLPIDIFLNQRYAKQERISEIKAEMEKLSNELKELEG